MNSDWIVTTIGEYCPFTYGKGLKKDDRDNSGEIPVYGSNGPVDTHIEGLIDQPGIIIGRKGSVGKVHLSNGSFWPIDTAFYTVKEDLEELWFTYYLLLSVGLDKMNSDSAVPGLNRDRAHSVTIKIPELLEERKRIGRDLRLLDQKIHLNKQTNETLEAMAQSIFKSWFVDFNPVRAKIEAKSAGRDPNRAVMATIAGISLEQDWDEIEATLDQKLSNMTEKQRQQLTRTAGLFPDELEESEIGEVPKGWDVKSIDSLTKKVSKGTTPSRKARANADDEPSIKFLKVKDVDEKGVIDRSDLSLISKSIHLNQLKRSILHENDILFSIAGTIGRVTFIDEDLENSNCNQALAFIRLKDAQKHFNLLLLNLKSKRIQDKALSLIVQGVQANLSLTNIKEFEIVVPEDELLAIWNSIISELLNMIKSKRQENRSLSELRDTLLPKLISGKLQI